MAAKPQKKNYLFARRWEKVFRSPPPKNFNDWDRVVPRLKKSIEVYRAARKKIPEIIADPKTSRKDRSALKKERRRLGREIRITIRLLRDLGIQEKKVKSNRK